MKANEIINEILKKERISLNTLGELLGVESENKTQIMWNALNGKNHNLKLDMFNKMLKVLHYKLIVVKDTDSYVVGE